MGKSKELFMLEQEIQAATYEDAYTYAPADSIQSMWFKIDNMTDEQRDAYLEDQRQRLISQIKAGQHDKLYDLQRVYAWRKRILFFCMEKTSAGNPIGEYLVSKMGVDDAIKHMDERLVTGCPETHRTWCD